MLKDKLQTIAMTIIKFETQGEVKRCKNELCGSVIYYGQFGYEMGFCNFDCKNESKQFKYVNRIEVITPEKIKLEPVTDKELKLQIKNLTLEINELYNKKKPHPHRLYPDTVLYA